MEVRKGERKRRKERKGTRGGTSLPRVPRSKDIPKSRISPNTGIPKQHSRDCHIEYSTIVPSQNIQLGLAEYCMSFYEIPAQFLSTAYDPT